MGGSPIDTAPRLIAKSPFGLSWWTPDPYQLPGLRRGTTASLQQLRGKRRAPSTRTYARHPLESGQEPPIGYTRSEYRLRKREAASYVSEGATDPTISFSVTEREMTVLASVARQVGKSVEVFVRDVALSEAGKIVRNRPPGYAIHAGVPGSGCSF